MAPALLHLLILAQMRTASIVSRLAKPAKVLTEKNVAKMHSGSSCLPTGCFTVEDRGYVFTNAEDLSLGAANIHRSNV